MVVVILRAIDGCSARFCERVTPIINAADLRPYTWINTPLQTPWIYANDSCGICRFWWILWFPTFAPLCPRVFLVSLIRRERQERQMSGARDCYNRGAGYCHRPQKTTEPGNSFRYAQVTCGMPRDCTNFHKISALLCFVWATRAPNSAKWGISVEELSYVKHGE